LINIFAIIKGWITEMTKSKSVDLLLRIARAKNAIKAELPSGNAVGDSEQLEEFETILLNVIYNLSELEKKIDPALDPHKGLYL